MCKIRDIIKIKRYRSNGVDIGQHSFVVLDDVGDNICGLPYDIVCNVLSSFKSVKQRKKKLSYVGNYPISPKDVMIVGGNNKEGYIKTDQLYYFNKQKIEYDVIGNMTVEAFNKLIEFINNSTADIIQITENLN